MPILIPAGVNPPTRQTDLIVTDFGPEAGAAARAIIDLTERPVRAFYGVAASVPLRLPLPGTHYDGGHPLVQALKATGCAFYLMNYVWICPTEAENDNHVCRPTCPVMEIAEKVAP